MLCLSRHNLRYFHISSRHYSSLGVPARFTLERFSQDRFDKIVKLAPSTRTNTESQNESSFDQIRLRKEVITALQSAFNITAPTLIQSLAIPEILRGKNVFCAGETGSGKTLAYLAPIFSSLKQEEIEGVLRMQQRPRAVILVPSRELVVQIESVAKSLSHHCKLRVEGIFDRKPKCRERLEGAIDIVISTPQKFQFQLDEGVFSLKDCRHVVVDEADTMMEKDFGEKLRCLIESVRAESPSCQFSFVSATVPKTLNQNLKQLFKDEMTHIVTPRIHRTVPTLRQRFIELTGHGDNKQRTLMRVLMDLPPKDVPTVIFCNTLSSVQSLHSWLSGVQEVVEVCGGADFIQSIHKEVPKQDRSNHVRNFQDGKVSLLLCTDLASRGLDTTKARHVILYDFPITVIDYLHRVGRTARNGTEGKATSLVSKRDRPLAKLIEKTLRSKIPLSSLSQ